MARSYFIFGEAMAGPVELGLPSASIEIRTEFLTPDHVTTIVVPLVHFDIAVLRQAVSRRDGTLTFTSRLMEDKPWVFHPVWVTNVEMPMGTERTHATVTFVSTSWKYLEN